MLVAQFKKGDDKEKKNIYDAYLGNDELNLALNGIVAA